MAAPPPRTTSPLPRLPEGWWAVGWKVLDGGRLAAVSADVDMWAAWRSDRAQHTAGEVSRLASQATARVFILRGDQLTASVEFPLLATFPAVEQFADGRWLIVNRRSPGDKNARILGPDGVEQRRIELGDGIEHVKVDGHGRIWVGWFDEGVFGNNKWLVEGLEWPPSSYGIAAFDDHGALRAHASLESVADCYALNVFDDEAWTCTYSDFPIWQMKDGRERVWRTNLSGVSAIAVNYPHVLAAGGYGGNANPVELLKLEDGQARSLGEWRLPFDTNEHSAVTLMDGRADELHVIGDGQWHRWRVADFVNQCD